MEHSYYKDRISAYKDSGLNTEEQYLISLHLQECAECRELLVKLESLDKMAERESNLPPDEYFEQLANRIDEKIAGKSAVVTDISPKSRWAGLTWKMAATAASVAVLIFIGYHKDDILPPTPFESPSSEAVRTLDILDSSATGRRDNSENQMPAASPKPSRAKLNRPLSTEGYFSDEDIAGNGEAKGDVEQLNQSSGQQIVDDDIIRSRKKSLREESSEVKDSSAKEKIFIRGGRTNEVSFIIDSISVDKEIDSQQGLLKGGNSKRIIDKFKTNSSVSISQQEIEEEMIDESDSNYKRARKSVLTNGDEVEEDNESFAEDSGLLDLRQNTEDNPVILLSSKWDDAVESFRNAWLKTRDSLKSTIRKSKRRRIQENKKRIISNNYNELAQNEMNLVLELELFDFLQIIVRDSKDSLETAWAIKITRQLAKFGYDETQMKARRYLDSLEVARSKSGELRK